MAGYDAHLINLVDARIKAYRSKDWALGTLVEVIGSYAYVAMDGSALALPCKYASGFPLVPDSRVTLFRYGSEWTVTGTFGRSSEVSQDKEDVMTPAAGFTLNEGTRARRDGKVVTVWGYLNMTGATITATSGNITDTTCATLAAPWVPPDQTAFAYGNGSMDGEGNITTAGAVVLRSANANIGTGTNIRFCVTYVQG